MGLPVDIADLPMLDTGQKRRGPRIARYVGPPAPQVSHSVTPEGREVPPTINDQPESGFFSEACSDHEVPDLGEEFPSPPGPFGQ